MNKKALLEFEVKVYGELKQYNEVLSKARCRIFYKYENRNGTYITDAFAEKLLSSLPYAPIKGIYNESDYTDHGQERSDGRIYGIVPENPNISWELSMDNDGVMREYACADVLIFTALYQEANEIVGKGQSMELYGPTLKYHEAMINNRRVIVFDDGCFLGLQVLGDNVEPCFEGASFYTLQNTIEQAIKQIKEYGGTNMPKINFKLSDDEKYQAIFGLLNPAFNEEGNWTISYCITAIYDEYALALNFETGDMERVYYTKNDDLNMIELGEHIKCYIEDVTESEKETLDTLRRLNGNTYELIDEKLVNAEENYNKVLEFSTEKEELNNLISTLQMDKEDLTGQIAQYTTDLEDLKNTNTSLNEEINNLREYKNSIELAQKQSILDEYSLHLSEEILEGYKNKMSEYTTEELDMHLAYELKKNHSSIFEKDNQSGYIPKDIAPDGIAAILSKYKNK